VNRSRARTIAVLGALILIPILAAGQVSDDPLLARQRELRDLKSKIEENRRKIESLKKKEKDLGKVDQRLRRDRELTARYLASLEEQERALLGDLTVRQLQLDERTAQQDHGAELLRERLRLYQRTRRPHAAELIFSSRNFAELFARGTYLARAIQKDRSDLLWLRQQRLEVAIATALLESRRTGLESLQEEKLREKARIEQRSAEAQNQIAKLRKERADFEARQQELARSESQIRSFISRLEAERRLAAKGGKKAPPSGPGLEGQRGRLVWPVRGDLVGRFGVEMHPRFGTKVPSNGIDIAAATGTPIAAVAGGTIEFVDWLPGYGRCVIVNHGGGYYTLYAHCSRTLVAKGSKVTAGQKVAEVGDTDSVKGSMLHFEIRRGQDAMNPEEWLQ
jgi:septal ring factor EnvC (AmiA/AmiB activator)